MAPYIDNPGWRGTETLFERVAWAATARLAQGDTRGARDLLEKGALDPVQLDPQPRAVHMLVLLARARRLDGDPEGAAEIEVSVAHLIERARAEGWNDLAFANYDPVMAKIDH